MSVIIQRSVYPSFNLCSQTDLYFKHNGNAILNIAESQVDLRRGGRVYTDTYFNSISIGKWKRHTSIKELTFNLTFKGQIKITWHVHRLNFSDRIVGENYLNSTDVETISIPLDFWKALEDGMLFFEVESLSSKSNIKDFSFSTSDVPNNSIKLGIVITHFNRQQYVIPAIERLSSQLLTQEEFRDKVSLNVVDNSSNLPGFLGVNIISNENLGGSGGFTRGLIHLKEQGNYTHCLFMDDDASCEVESIRRTVSLLEFAKDPSAAIAGAMLREAEMFRQFENGARFDGICKPNKCNLDLRNKHDLLVNELEEHIDYGGWWFLAFPISKVTNLAFPYFVRGDDIGFGLKHKFNIITLNGISTWGDDFSLKNGPLPYYLDVRNHIMQHFHGLVDGGFKGILKTTMKMCLRNLFTYHYETALAAIIAVEDCTKGKNFWIDNASMSDKRKEISSLVINEKPEDILLDVASQAINGNPHETRISRCVRLLTLNGHLLPKMFFKKGRVWQHKGFGGNLREVYRYNDVLYIHWTSNKGFILKHDKKKFFNHLIRYTKAIYNLYKNYNRLENEYRSSYDELTSTEFWKKQFKQDQ